MNTLAAAGCAAVELKEVTKKYREQTVLNHLSFSIPAGGIFGLLGPNGAGKTTLLKAIAGLVRPSEGEISIFGRNAERRNAKLKGMIGLVPQDNNMERELTVDEALKIYGKLYAVANLKERIEEIIRKFSLEPLRSKEIRNLSGGMMRRVLIARALLPKPDLLLLDEPTVGLDPDIRFEIWEIIQQLIDVGKTVVLTTHYMEEAEQLCRQIAILRQGELVFFDTPERIRQHFSDSQGAGAALETLFLQLARGGRA